jgi:septum formation protein
MTLWMAERALVLASKSEARRKILDSANVPVEPVPAVIDERAVEAKAGPLSASATAILLARVKAAAVSAHKPGRLVLGADQTLALGARRFSKPRDRAAAHVQLTALSGKTHELHSAVALLRDGKILFEHADTARLTMRVLSSDFLDSYLNAAGDAATASVGGYQIEGAGIHLFEHIAGDYFTILGLPLLPLLQFLREEGLVET